MQPAKWTIAKSACDANHCEWMCRSHLQSRASMCTDIWYDLALHCTHVDSIQLTSKITCSMKCYNYQFNRRAKQSKYTQRKRPTHEPQTKIHSKSTLNNWQLRCDVLLKNRPHRTMPLNKFKWHKTVMQAVVVTWGRMMRETWGKIPVRIHTPTVTHKSWNNTTLKLTRMQGNKSEFVVNAHTHKHKISKFRNRRHPINMT